MVKSSNLLKIVHCWLFNWIRACLYLRDNKKQQNNIIYRLKQTQAIILIFHHCNRFSSPYEQILLKRLILRHKPTISLYLKNSLSSLSNLWCQNRILILLKNIIILNINLKSYIIIDKINLDGSLQNIHVLLDLWCQLF